MNARNLRITEAVPFVKRFAARWVYTHGLAEHRADDVESDALFVTVLLADEFDPTRGVPWMAYLSGRLRHRLISEYRARHGRSANATRRAIYNTVALADTVAIPDPGYDEADARIELDRLLRPHPLRTRSIVRARLAGRTAAEIGAAHGVGETRVYQLLKSVRS